MKAPTKQRSTKATKRVDLWVDLRRKRVRIAHTAARVETMKRVLQDACQPDTLGLRLVWVGSAYKIEAEVSRFAFWLISTKYAWCGQLRPLRDGYAQ